MVREELALQLRLGDFGSAAALYLQLGEVGNAVNMFVKSGKCPCCTCSSMPYGSPLPLMARWQTVILTVLTTSAPSALALVHLLALMHFP